MRVRLAAALRVALILGAAWALSAGAAFPAAARAETVSLPSGAATGTSQNDLIYQVACPAAGDCVGVGAYTDTSGNHQGLIETERSGVWSAANVPDASLPHAALTPAPKPYLTGVACTSVGNCVAVDAYDDSGGDEQGLIDVESGGGWTPIEAPLAGVQPVFSNPGVEVADVSCPAAGACVGIGSYVGASTYEQGLIETQSGSGWSAAEMPMPAGSDPVSSPNFYDISCASAGNCAAVGYYTDVAGNQQGLLETDSDGVWQPAQELDLSNLQPAGDPQAAVSDVSCSAAGSCTAVGSYEDAAGINQAFAVQEVGGVWQPAIALLLPGDASSSAVGTNVPQYDLFIDGVSCASTGNCTAVGSYDATSANDVEPFTLTERGGSWGAGTRLALPGDAGEGPATNPDAALYSVTCESAADCLAAGTYAAGGSENMALLARQSGGSWTVAAADLSSPYDSNLAYLYWASVACAPGGYCAAGGYVADDESDNEDGFILDAPGAPAGVGATLSGAQASVSWPAPRDTGGLPISGYTVTANDLTNPASGGQTVSVAASATSATVTGLVPSDSYNFTVTPSSLLGSGVSATSATVSATAPHASLALTRAQIHASLSVLLKRRGLAAGLRRLRRMRRYAARYRVLEPGRLTVRWYREQTLRHHRRRRIVFASGTSKARRAGQRLALSVRLTRAGRRLVKSGWLSAKSHRRLTVVAGFMAAGARPVTRSGSLRT